VSISEFCTVEDGDGPFLRRHVNVCRGFQPGSASGIAESRNNYNPMLARRYVLEGRVQGVGFRYFVYHHAHLLRINGWVRNLADGSVEVHAEGVQESMSQFLSRIRSGPPFAVVADVRIHDVPVEDLQGFSVVR
jgi:acylphosphatase